ncbi:MAG: ABC transporter substrate-binding protein [Solirubrobacteraceae bacterium]
MGRRISYLSACVAVSATLAACGGNGSSTSHSAAVATNGQLASVSWAPLEGEPRSLAVGQATAGYPEMTVMSNLCDNILRLTPQETVEPGLARLAAHPNALTYVFKMRAGPRFWDGHPVTAADAVFSLKQSIQPTAANDFVLSDVKSVQQLGGDEFAVHLFAPFVAFPDYLASDAGTVAEKAYVLAKGSAYGTPRGGVMCSGPFKFGTWVRGQSLTILRNTHYWDRALEPHVGQIKFQFLSDPTTLTSALLSGAVDGTFAAPPTDLTRLQSSPAGTLTQGPSLQIASLSLTATNGPLANAQVREALNIAVNRSAFVKAVYYGAADPDRSAILPPTQTYQQSVFQRAYSALPGATPETAMAARLVREAGFKGAPITIATSADPTLTPIALYLQSVANAIGLKAKLKQYPSAAQYLTLFYDAKARQGIDAMININFTVIPEPLDFIATLALPTGLSNYDRYSNPQVTKLIGAAFASNNEATRARLITQADTIFERAPNTIMLALPKINLWQSTKVTGAPANASYWSFPWGSLLRPTKG